MKVIKVSDAIEKRDNTVVTVTPVSLRANAEQFVFSREVQAKEARVKLAMSEATEKDTPEKAPNSKRAQPHFIFGRE
jgi:hypothetical protein